jgi:hypothetical protein
MVRIIRPDFKTHRNGQPVALTLSDYIEVPRLDTIGTWNFGELLDVPTLARLSNLRDNLAGVIRRKR